MQSCIAYPRKFKTFSLPASVSWDVMETFVCFQVFPTRSTQQLEFTPAFISTGEF